MKLRPVPDNATWVLKLFCSTPEHESLIGDLLEEYQRGRGRFWFWRQVIAIVFLELHRKARRSLVSTNRIAAGQGMALIFLIAALSAVLLSDIWPLGLVGILGGIIAGGLKFWYDSGRIEPAKSTASAATLIQGDPSMSDTAAYHPGISINHIPVEGAVGFLFVIATVLIFGGILAVREILILTAPVGVLASAILFYWHRRHPLEIEALDLQKQK